MFSTPTRWLTFLTAALYAALGLSLFVAPESLAPGFAWKVSPFVAMTIGAWALGNAWLAWVSARRASWRLVYSSLVYLWLFGAGEAAVLIAFRERLVVSHPIAWLYLAALAANLTAAVGVAELRRALRTRPNVGPALRRGQRLPIVAFVVFVGFLGVYGLLAPLGAPGTNGGIFPEVLSPFSLRSFAAFYLALALGTATLLSEPSLPPVLHHAYAAYGLIVTITAAAVVYLRLFDFVARPGGLLYLGAYLAVGIPVLIALRVYGTGGSAAG